MPSCLIIVENLPVPPDRRVWQEARALKADGWDVSVICPRTPQHPETEIVIEGIRVFRHSLPLEGRGAFGLMVEYAVALSQELRLAFKVWRRHGFDVIHICNPPDLLFLVALPFKLLGKKVVFDHHDICPELWVSKTGQKGFMFRLLGIFEKLTMRTADVVVSANETFRSLAIGRGGKHPDDVFTVYSIPDTSRFFRMAGRERRDDAVVVGYAGIHGKQDGIDNLIRAIAVLKHGKGLGGFRCSIVGDGPERASLEALAAALDVADLVEFTGFLAGDAFLQAISGFDIGVIPDPPDEYNDKISMNKVFEYATLGIPIVSFDLSETKRLLEDAGAYAKTPDPEGLAEELARLIEDPELRGARGLKALDRAREHFRWPAEAANLLSAYRRALKDPMDRKTSAAVPTGGREVRQES